MTKKTWVDNDDVTSTQLNRIEDQLVVICTSATRPTGVEGQHIYETDTDTTLVYGGSDWVVVAEPPQSWSPTITQGSAVSGSTVRGWYQRHRGVFHAVLHWQASASGTAGQQITLPPPVTLAHASDAHGAFHIQDVGVTYIAGAARAITTIGIGFIEGGTGDIVGLAYTIAAGDTLRLDLTGRYA